MPDKRILVLAKSHKIGGWCIAGKEISHTKLGDISIGGWIRPVSSNVNTHGAVGRKNLIYCHSQTLHHVENSV